MDLRESDAETALRLEVRDVAAGQPAVGVRQGPPAALRRPRRGGRVRPRVAGASSPSGRWVGVAWPEEYGGRGAGPVEHYIVQEELARARAPELVGRIGVNLVGPTLLAHGTPEQKAALAARASSGADELWCQLFSEPGAGSDLASLSTRAERRSTAAGSLNGQKVWTSLRPVRRLGRLPRPHRPRRRRSSRGISLPRRRHARRRASRCGRCARSPTRPSSTRCSSPTCSCPTTSSSAPVDEGWRVANSTLTHERGTNPRQLVIHTQLLEELLRLALERGAFDDHAPAQRLAEAYVEVRLFQLHNWRSLSRLAKGLRARARGQRAEAVLERDEQAPPRHRDGRARRRRRRCGGAPTTTPATARWQRSWLYYQASSIFAGTNEIQRNIIGERVLGLPASRSRVGL